MFTITLFPCPTSNGSFHSSASLDCREICSSHPGLYVLAPSRHFPISEFEIVAPAPSPSTSKAAPPPASASVTDKQILKALRKSASPAFLFPSKSIPRLSKFGFVDITLEAPLPAEIDSKVLSGLVASHCRRAKAHLRAANLTVSHLPKAIVSDFESQISASYKKTLLDTKFKGISPATMDTKKPKSKSAQPAKSNASAPAKPETPKPSKAQTPAPAKPKPSQPSKAPSSLKPAPASKVLDVLKSSRNPAFYFDSQPSFDTLFPRTTKPPSKLRSGTPYVEKKEFSPLLVSMVKSAHKALAKCSIKVQKLPNSFMTHLERLILHSLAAPSAKKGKGKKASPSKASSGKPPTFVPQTKPVSPPVPQTSSLHDPIDDMRSLRDFRAQIELTIVELETSVLSHDSRPFNVLIRSPLYKEYFHKEAVPARLSVSEITSAQIPLPGPIGKFFYSKTTQTRHNASSTCRCPLPNGNCTSGPQNEEKFSAFRENLFPHLPIPDRAPTMMNSLFATAFYFECKRVHKLVSSRSTLHYESVLSEKKD